jgi:hypothetical protein
MKAMEPVAEVQTIMSKSHITTAEAARVYPIGKSTLDQMRLARTGPEFIQLEEKGPVAYTHKAIQDWLNRHRQKVLQ